MLLLLPNVNTSVGTKNEIRYDFVRWLWMKSEDTMAQLKLLRWNCQNKLASWRDFDRKKWNYQQFQLPVLANASASVRQRCERLFNIPFENWIDRGN